MQQLITPVHWESPGIPRDCEVSKQRDGEGEEKTVSLCAIVRVLLGSGSAVHV